MRRRMALAVAAVGALLLAAPEVIDPRPRLIWNASASVPLGLYRARGVADLAVGDLVAVEPPADLAAFIADRGYLPRGVPLLKHVAALGGSVVCRDGTAVRIDGRPAAVARPTDSRDRPLPAWSGCRTIASGEVFLLNPEAVDSFDGRYFGPLPRDAIDARLTPIWTTAGSADPQPPGRRPAREP